MNNDEIQRVPLIAYELKAERARRTMKGIAIGWGVSVAALLASLAYIIVLA